MIKPLFEDQVDFETFSESDFRAVKVLACEAVPKPKKLLKFMLDDGTGTERTILSGIHASYEPEQLVGRTCVAFRQGRNRTEEYTMEVLKKENRFLKNSKSMEIVV